MTFFNEVDVKQILATLIIVSALAAAGCSSDTRLDRRPRLPTSPSSPLVTENFAGTVSVGGSDVAPVHGDLVGSSQSRWI